MWTSYINVPTKVANIQVTSSELVDITFGLKLAEADPELIQKFEDLATLMRGENG